MHKDWQKLEKAEVSNNASIDLKTYTDVEKINNEVENSKKCSENLIGLQLM